MAGDTQTFNLRIKVGTQGVQEITSLDNKVGRLGNTTERTGGAVGRFRQGISSLPPALRSTIAAVGLLLAVISTGIAVVSSGAQAYIGYERSMSNVASVANANAEGLRRLSQAAREQAATSVFTARESANAQYYLASAGMSVNQIITAQRGVMDLAAATQADLASTSETVAATLSQFGLRAEASTRVANVFAAAISGSQANMEKLSTAMRYVGPIAATLGQSLELTTAQLMALYDGGLQGMQAGTGLRMAMLRLQNPTTEAAKTLARLNVEIKDSAGKVRPLLDVLADLKAANMQAGDAAEIFGTETASAVMILTNSIDKVRQYEQAVTGTDAASRMASRQMNNLWGDLKKMGSAAEESAIGFMEKLAPAIRLVVQGLTWMVGNIGTVTGLVLAGAAAWGSYQVATAGAAVGWRVFINAVRMDVWTPLLAKLGAVAAFLTGPAGLVMGAAAMTAGMIAMGNAAGYSGDKLRGALDDMNAANDAWGEARGKLKSLEGALGDFEEKISEAAGDQAKEKAAVEALNRLYPHLVGHYNNTAQAIDNVNKRRGTLLLQAGSEAALVQAQALLSTRETFDTVDQYIKDAEEALREYGGMAFDYANSLASTEQYQKAIKEMERRAQDLMKALVDVNKVALNENFPPEVRQTAAAYRDRIIEILEKMQDMATEAPNVQDAIGRMLAQFYQDKAPEEALIGIREQMEAIRDTALNTQANLEAIQWLPATLVDPSVTEEQKQIAEALKAAAKKAASEAEAARKLDERLAGEHFKRKIQMARGYSFVAGDVEKQATQAGLAELTKRTASAKTVLAEATLLAKTEKERKVAELQDWYDQRLTILQAAYGDSEQFHQAKAILDAAYTRRSLDELKKFADGHASALARVFKSWADVDKNVEESTKWMLQSVQQMYTNTIAGFLKGEINSLGDLWEALCDNMINIFANFVAQIATIWTTANIASLFGVGDGVDLGSLLGLGQSDKGGGGVVGTASTLGSLITGAKTVAGWLGLDSIFGGTAALTESALAADAAMFGAMGMEGTTLLTESALAADAAMFGQMGMEGAMAGTGLSAMALPALAAVGPGMAGSLIYSQNLFGMGDSPLSADEARDLIQGQIDMVIRLTQAYEAGRVPLDLYGQASQDAAAALEKWRIAAEYSEADIQALISSTGELGREFIESGQAAYSLENKLGSLIQRMNQSANSYTLNAHEAKAFDAEIDALAATLGLTGDSLEAFRKEVWAMSDAFTTGGEEAGAYEEQLDSMVSGILKQFSEAMGDNVQAVDYLNDALNGLPDEIRTTVLVNYKYTGGGESPAKHWDPMTGGVSEYHNGGVVMHGGGSVATAWASYEQLSRLAADEVLAKLQLHEYVVRNSSVNAATLPWLDFVNDTGRPPVMVEPVPVMIPLQDQSPTPALEGGGRTLMIDTGGAPLFAISGAEMDKEELVEELMAAWDQKMDEMFRSS